MLSNTLILGSTLIYEFLDGLMQEMKDYMDGKLFAGEFAGDSEWTKYAERNATGASKRSLQVVNVTNSSGQLVGTDSIEYVFRGRGPGKIPPLNKIIDWCNAKGLPRGIAWVVAKKIAESGSALHRALKAQGRNSVLDLIITPEKIKEFTDSIAKVYVAQLNSDIVNALAA